MKRFLALILALMVHLLTLGFLALGAWAVLAHLDSLLAWVLGGLSLAVGWVLRPRLGSLPADAEVLDRAGAPELYAVADRVADRVGVRRPAKVAIRDLATETHYERVGLSRTPVLVVGLPLWLALPPKQRVILLATGYAHVPAGEELIVNGALSTLDAWRDALFEAGPLRVREEAQTKMTASSLGVGDQPGTTYEVAGFFGRLFGRVLGGPVLLVAYVLTRLTRAGESRVVARRQALAERVATARELAALEELTAGGGYLAPMQAAALRGESVPAIRQRALARFQLTDDGVLTSAPQSELLGTRESELIDAELLPHYTRAIRGFGLIS
ncbi:M48 family metallopeptidase [Nonomuraea sp. K274]|uniref:M48 family metallopeptidase n=1 Tax=Nonomuraea cypriaca TaxID=1187855 RepID=A0A931AHR5_9ACTN|nr:M48 family metallopeptidase [Nonomuraea cypriaca]MBF8192193.1 M48 family metallopeptidase [Nonomuraea cypriaca]